MEIRWLRLALRDLDKIAEYISKENPEAAKNIVKLIWEKTKVLTDYPDIGRSGRVSGTRELYIGGSRYMVPYRVKSDHIQILRVLHTSRKWPKDL